MSDPTSDPTSDPGAPRLRIVKGDPTPEEIAALVVVVAALGDTRTERATQPPSQWAAHHRKLRFPVSARRGGWRAGSLPR